MNRKQPRAEKKQAKPLAQRASPGVQEMFADALRHHQAGRLNEAERLYRQVRAVDPHHADSLHLLGVIASQLGHHDVAVDLIKKAIAINAKDPAYHSNLGLVLKTQGNLDDAMTSYRKALDIKPDYPEAHNDLGTLLQDQGRLDEAATSYQRAIEFRSNYPEAHNNLGTVLYKQGRFEEAIAHYRRALDLKFDYPEAHNNLGSVLKDLGQLDEAVAHCRKALALNPNYAEAYVNLGNALQDQTEHLDEAVTCYLTALTLKPDTAEAYYNLGTALQTQGRTNEAMASYRRALDLQPDYAAAYYNIGYMLSELGRLTEAGDYMEKAIQLSPRDPTFYLGLANSRKFTAEDPHLAIMQELAQDIERLSVKEKIDLHFALGKVLTDIKLYDQSFQHLLQGNALKRLGIAYDENAALGIFQRIRAVFTPELMRRNGGLGDPTTAPVFVLGMPRSGTTLVEQILASHKKVFGAGELKDLGKIISRLSDRAHIPFPEIASSMSADDLLGIAKDYLDAIRAIAPRATLITDKMPLNFYFIGLIHLALPHARIVHVRRDPMDNCLSCFSTLFSAGHPFTYDLGEMGRFYHAYQGLMQHWRDVLPSGVMLDVHYEEVVADIEGQAQRLVKFCGLEWDDSCLDFYKTQRLVRTASVVQVRQPIYKSSVGRWYAYEQFLAPLKDALASP